MKIQSTSLMKRLPILFIIVFSFIFGLAGTSYAPNDRKAEYICSFDRGPADRNETLNSGLPLYCSRF